MSARSPGEHADVVREALNHSAGQTMKLVEFGNKYAATRRQFGRQFGDRAWNIHLQPAYDALAALVAVAEDLEGQLDDALDSLAKWRAVAEDATRQDDNYAGYGEILESLTQERDRLRERVAELERAHQGIVDAYSDENEEFLMETIYQHARAALSGGTAEGSTEGTT